MTISSTNRKAGPFAGNGVTTAFPFAFKVFIADDVLVVQAVTATGVETVKALTADYTVAINADQNANPGGTVTMLVAPPTGTMLVATSQVANLQPLDVTNGGGFFPSILNASFDRATIQIQQLAEKLSRALKTAITTPVGVSSDLPAPAAYKVLAWNNSATALENVDMIAGQSALAGNLTASSGASLVGYLPPATGSLATTVKAQIDFLLTAQVSVNRAPFYADKTGAVNATAAFQAAIDSLPANGGTITGAAGTYLLDTITLPVMPKVVNIRLDGIGSVNLQMASPTGVLFKKADTGAVASAIDGAVYEGFTVIAHAGANRTINTNKVFDIVGFRNCTWRKIGYKGNGTGSVYVVFDMSISVTPFNPTFNNTFEGIQVLNTYGPTVVIRAGDGGNGYLYNPNIIAIRDCWFYYSNGSSAIIDLTKSFVATISNTWIESCTTATAIRCGQATTVQGCWLEGNNKNFEFDGVGAPDFFSASGCVLIGNYANTSTVANTISGSVNIPPVLIGNTGAGFGTAAQWTGAYQKIESPAGSATPATPTLSGGDGTFALASATVPVPEDFTRRITYYLEYSNTPASAGVKTFALSTPAGFVLEMYVVTIVKDSSGLPAPWGANYLGYNTFYANFPDNTAHSIKVRATYKRL